jgi:hypothetical protein
MATLTLEYNTRNLLAEKTKAYILSLGIFKTKKNGLDFAIEQLREGKTIKCNDFNDYLEKVK